MNHGNKHFLQGRSAMGKAVSTRSSQTVGTHRYSYIYRSLGFHTRYFVQWHCHHPFLRANLITHVVTRFLLDNTRNRHRMFILLCKFHVIVEKTMVGCQHNIRHIPRGMKATNQHSELFNSLATSRNYISGSGSMTSSVNCIMENID